LNVYLRVSSQHQGRQPLNDSVVFRKFPSKETGRILCSGNAFAYLLDASFQIHGFTHLNDLNVPRDTSSLK